MKLDMWLLALAQALLATCALLVPCGVRSESTTVYFEIPRVMRTEGRITFEYASKTRKTTHVYTFSEVIDSDTKRSKISIGQPSYEPSIYYARGDVLVSKNSKTGRYQQLTDIKGTPVKFVPELEWFLKLTYTDAELRDNLPASLRHYVGPSGILEMLMRNHQIKHDNYAKFRGIECIVQTARYSRTKANSILLENFMPTLPFLDEQKDLKGMTFFSLREIVKNAKDPSNSMSREFDANMTLDYFSTERIDKKNSLQLERLERDLSLPLGEGVGQFFRSYVLDATSNSFMMTFEELNDPEGRLTMLAYDHQFNYLRKESVGSSVSVWDLNEDLLYHVDLNFQGGLTSSHDIEVPLEQCSVLSVEDERPRKDGTQEEGDSDPARLDRPYESRGTSLVLTAFLGASRLVYMGRSTVRDLPCAVYETILSEAPKVFQLKLVRSPILKAKPDTKNNNGEDDYEFIVQYHLLETLIQQVGYIKNTEELYVLNERFWPARIKLYKRRKSTGGTVLVNALEIHDFHLGLYGWDRKPSQLFMMPQCFDDEDEQLKISMLLDFQPTLDEEDQKRVALSKYKLEFDLMNSLFRSLELSRLHLTEYSFALQRHGQASASFVISDRMQDKRVSYFGEGELPKSDSYANNRIELQAGQQYTAESCLMGASHIKDISLVIHCPAQGGGTTADWPTCTAVFGETQPVVKLSKASRTTACQAFLFETREPPKSGVKSVESHRQELQDFEFGFTPREGQGLKDAKKFMVRARDFEVTRAQQLVIISNYHFALPAEDSRSDGALSSDDTELATPASDASGESAIIEGQGVQQKKLRNVRHIDSIAYESVGDCARICNLDANCRSYSYCRRESGKPGKQSWDVTPIDKQEVSRKDEQRKSSETLRCVLSSLDLRTNNVDKQLMNARVDKTNNLVEVKDLELAARGNPLGVYSLEMMSGCDVHERDIMSIFTPTEELVRVDARTLERVLTATSVSECARRVVALEAKSSHAGASFAYCPRTQACLTDENLFGSIGFRGPTDRDDDDDDNNDNDHADGSKQVACEMYRKRYQTYFHLSPKVVKRISAEGGGEPAHANIVKHIDLSLGTVEECAHACWQSYGHVCLSFDYCSPSLCSLNIVDDKTTSDNFDASSIEYETRAGCLGYRRDLRWDQLRREHLIGSHNLLGLELRPGAHGRGRGIFLNLVLMCLSAVLFAAGLLVGRVFNDHLEIATSTWRSAPASSDGNSSASTAGPFASTFGMRARINGGDRFSTVSKFNIENEIYEDPDAIRLEDFDGQNGSMELQEEDDVGASELPASPADKKLTEDQRRAGYMNIPDLL